VHCAFKGPLGFTINKEPKTADRSLQINPSVNARRSDNVELHCKLPTSVPVKPVSVKLSDKESTQQVRSGLHCL